MAGDGVENVVAVAALEGDLEQPPAIEGGERFDFAENLPPVVGREVVEIFGFPAEGLRELALALGPKGEVAMSTAAEIWMKEGEARGEARGEAKGKAEGVLSVLEGGSQSARSSARAFWAAVTSRCSTGG